MKTLEQLDTTDAEAWVRTRFGVLRGHPAWRSLIDAFNAGQVHARAACRAEALEEAAQVADEFRAKTLAAQVGDASDLSNLMLRQLAELGYGQCAAAIREMK